VVRSTKRGIIRLWFISRSLRSAIDAWLDDLERLVATTDNPAVLSRQPTMATRSMMANTVATTVPRVSGDLMRDTVLAMLIDTNTRCH
jgi:hypothetical protein